MRSRAAFSVLLLIVSAFLLYPFFLAGKTKVLWPANALSSLNHPETVGARGMSNALAFLAFSVGMCQMAFSRSTSAHLALINSPLRVQVARRILSINAFSMPRAEAFSR